jgi:hypothetical protein
VIRGKAIRGVALRLIYADVRAAYRPPSCGGTHEPSLSTPWSAGSRSAAGLVARHLNSARASCVAAIPTSSCPRQPPDTWP